MPASITEHGKGAETDHRHACGKAIHTVHEVVQVDHPDQEQQAEQNPQPFRPVPGQPRQRETRQKQSSDHEQRGGHEMSRQAHTHRQSLLVVQK